MRARGEDERHLFAGADFATFEVSALLPNGKRKKSGSCSHSCSNAAEHYEYENDYDDECAGTLGRRA